MKRIVLLMAIVLPFVFISCSEDEEKNEPVNASIEHEFVDLGLPSGTLWATCNIGADAPEEYGAYFAWGETTRKDIYTWETYKWCKGSYSTMTKYCTDSNNGTVDGKRELDPEDDAAYVCWGASWRMPTTEQQKELIEKCTWEPKTLKGVNGRLVTGPNGKTLFFPAAGYYEDGLLHDAGSSCSCWSRSCYTSNMISNHDYSACDIGFYSDDLCYLNGKYHLRYYGHSVRAVRASNN